MLASAASQEAWSNWRFMLKSEGLQQEECRILCRDIINQIWEPIPTIHSHGVPMASLFGAVFGWIWVIGPWS